MNLRLVGVHLWAIGVDAGLQFHLGRNNCAQNLEAFLDHLLETDRLEIQRRALAEHAKFVDKIACVVAGFKNLLERFMSGMAFRHVHGHEFGAAENAGDQIIEFVRHSAGELVKGVKSLSLQQAEFVGQARRIAPGPAWNILLRFPVGASGLLWCFLFHQNIGMAAHSYSDGGRRFCPPHLLKM